MAIITINIMAIITIYIYIHNSLITINIIAIINIINTMAIITMNIIVLLLLT